MEIAGYTYIKPTPSHLIPTGTQVNIKYNPYSEISLENGSMFIAYLYCRLLLIRLQVFFSLSSTWSNSRNVWPSHLEWTNNCELQHAGWAKQMPEYFAEDDEEKL